MRRKESEILEFKKSTAELKNSLEDICAFANNGEGTVYFGISDGGNIIGQSVSDATMKKITTTILSSIEPRVYPNIFIESIQGKSIIVVEVKNGPDKPYFYKGKAYKRTGTSNVYLSRYEIEKYLYERDNPAYRFDKTILKDYDGKIDAKALKWFKAQASEKRNIPANISTDVILKNIGAHTNGQLNVGGILTFGRNIQRYLLNATVKCAVFSGVDNAGRIIDHLEIHENVFRAIDQAEEFVLRNIRKSAWINDQTGRREEQYEVPYAVIREAIANAIAHRDYRLTGNVDIAIYDDRIEIFAPGKLPVGVTLRAIRSAKRFSIPRNPVISEALFLAGYIEKWGTGLNKMKSLMMERGLRQPEYDLHADNFVVTLLRPIKKKAKKNAEKRSKRTRGKPGKKTVEKTVEKAVEKTVEIILEAIRNDPKMTQNKLMTKTGLTRRGVEWNLRKLKEEGRIRRVGPARGGRWEVLDADGRRSNADDRGFSTTDPRPQTSDNRLGKEIL